jgi:hypothetical protein
MFRQILAELDRATGGRLRRVAGLDAVYTGPVVSLADDRARVAGLMDLVVLQAPRIVTLDDERLRAFLSRQTAVTHDGGAFQTEEVFNATLRGVTFDPHSGAVWAADGALVLDSIKNAGRLKHVTASPLAPGELAGLHSSIAGPISGNTFHWLVESLPRLYSLATLAEPVTLLMTDTLPAARREQLVGCLPPNAMLRFVPPHRRLRVERFVLPSFLTTLWDFAYLPSDHLDYLRQRFFRVYGLSPQSSSNNRIYISRARAGARRVLNEAAVLEALRPLGFRLYYLESMRFAEQVRLFHDAAIVVAPHGAGLANLLFAGSIPVLEFTSRVISPVYFFLALALRQKYEYVYPLELAASQPLPSPADGRLYSTARDLDITVDLDAMRAVTERWR